MREVAEITPIGSDPGLVAFVCTYCGAADSAIVYPKNKTSEMDLSQTQVPADLTRWMSTAAARAPLAATPLPRRRAA